MLSAVARPSVCLSVRLSVTRVDQSKTVEQYAPLSRAYLCVSYRLSCLTVISKLSSRIETRTEEEEEEEEEENLRMVSK